jgi:large subunit ribosomal protein L4
LNAGDVFIVDDFKLTSVKTKEFVGVLAALEVKGSALVVGTGDNKNLTLASRNVPKIELTTSDDLNTYQVLKSDKLVFTKSAFEKVEARLTKE